MFPALGGTSARVPSWEGSGSFWICYLGGTSGIAVLGNLGLWWGLPSAWPALSVGRPDQGTSLTGAGGFAGAVPCPDPEADPHKGPGDFCLAVSVAELGVWALASAPRSPGLVLYGGWQGSEWTWRHGPREEGVRKKPGLWRLVPVLWAAQDRGAGRSVGFVLPSLASPSIRPRAVMEKEEGESLQEPEREARHGRSSLASLGTTGVLFPHLLSCPFGRNRSPQATLAGQGRVPRLGGGSCSLAGRGRTLDTRTAL